jgi:glycerol-3-phosphate acyltransferase PlsX
MQQELYLRQKVNNIVSIGIDLMGADLGSLQPSHAVLFEAACLFAKEKAQKNTRLVCYATGGVIEELEKSSHVPSIHFYECKDVVTMEDAPLEPLKQKKHSSLTLGMKSLREKEIDAFITCANTAALVSASTYLLKTTERPALAIVFPTATGEAVILDVGAVLQCKKERYLDLAHQGMALATRLEKKRKARLGLLNIAKEPKKGGKEMQEAWQVLKSHFAKAFVGNVEPKDVFDGKADVVVTSGFCGNIFLKTAEACAEAFGMKELFSHLRHAILCGVQGIVIKCHGASCADDVLFALLHAETIAKKKNIYDNIST